MRIIGKNTMGLIVQIDYREIREIVSLSPSNEFIDEEKAFNIMWEEIKKQNKRTGTNRKLNKLNLNYDS